MHINIECMIIKRFPGSCGQVILRSEHLAIKTHGQLIDVHGITQLNRGGSTGVVK